MNITDTLSKLLPDLELTEDFVNKLSALIEKVVVERVEQETKEIQEKAEACVLEAKKQIEETNKKAEGFSDFVIEEMTRRVEDYCAYAVDEFVKEHKAQLVKTEEYCRMSETLGSIRESFQRNYFALSNQPANVELQEKLNNTKKSFNELFEENRKLKADNEKTLVTLEETKRFNVFSEKTKDLAETHRCKLANLMERLKFDSLEMYTEGLDLMIKDMNMKEKPETTQKILESVKTTPSNKTNEDDISHFMSLL